MLQHSLHQIQFWLHPDHQQHSSSCSQVAHPNIHPPLEESFPRDSGEVKAQATLTSPLLDTTVVADPPCPLERRVLSCDSLSCCRLPRSSRIPAQERPPCLVNSLCLELGLSWMSSAHPSPTDTQQLLAVQGHSLPKAPLTAPPGFLWATAFPQTSLSSPPAFLLPGSPLGAAALSGWCQLGRGSFQEAAAAPAGGCWCSSRSHCSAAVGLCPAGLCVPSLGD